MLSAAFGAVFLFSSATANAQTGCGKRDDIIAVLEENYQEKASAIGIAGKAGVVELYTSESGSWTLLLTQASGVTCMIAAGENWEQLAPKQDKSQWRDS